MDVYNLARKYKKKTHALVRTLPKEEQFNLANQMRRAATSLTNNIAEGHGRYHCQENIQFLRQSRGSLEELFDDLNICPDENYNDKDFIEKLKQQGYVVLKKLNGYINT